jgi:hypothetical protein
MHFEVLIGAVAEELRAARPEVGEPGDVIAPVKSRVRGKKREAFPDRFSGKADDTGEEPGKGTQWDRRDMGSGIRGKTRRQTSRRSR